MNKLTKSIVLLRKKIRLPYLDFWLDIGLIQIRTSLMVERY